MKLVAHESSSISSRGQRSSSACGRRPRKPPMYPKRTRVFGKLVACEGVTEPVCNRECRLNRTGHPAACKECKARRVNPSVKGVSTHLDDSSSLGRAAAGVGCGKSISGLAKRDVVDEARHVDGSDGSAVFRTDAEYVWDLNYASSSLKQSTNQCINQSMSKSVNPRHCAATIITKPLVSQPHHQPSRLPFNAAATVHCSL